MCHSIKCQVHKMTERLNLTRSKDFRLSVIILFFSVSFRVFEGAMPFGQLAVLSTDLTSFLIRVKWDPNRKMSLASFTYERVSWWNCKLIKLQVDKIASWWNGKLIKWQLMKLQVDEMAFWWNGLLMKLQVDEMASWWNDKLIKWLVDEMAVDENG